MANSVTLIISNFNRVTINLWGPVPEPVYYFRYTMGCKCPADPAVWSSIVAYDNDDDEQNSSSDLRPVDDISLPIILIIIIINKQCLNIQDHAKYI